MFGLSKVPAIGKNGATPDISGTVVAQSNPWSQQQKLAASDGEENDSFGRSAAVSADGKTALIGAAGNNNQNGEGAGSAYVFTQSDGEWSQQQKLTADNGGKGDGFGRSIAMSTGGETALIGSRDEVDPDGRDDGAAYVFTRNDGEWNQQQRLTANDGDEGDRFGDSVAISGDGETAVIGAPDDENPNGYAAGSAYVFELRGDVWNQEQKLSARDGGRVDIFGRSVAISDDGEILFIGSSAESAYVFTQRAGRWNQQQRITINGGEQRDEFGRSVAVSDSGKVAVIGAYNHSEQDAGAIGAAYVFTRNEEEWSQEKKLTADDGDVDDQFGRSVTVSPDGNTALIGAFLDDDPNGSLSGSAYVFTQDSGNWIQEQKLVADDGNVNDRFGAYGLALSDSGETAVIGAFGDEDPNGDAAGSVYAFSRVDEEFGSEPGNGEAPSDPQERALQIAGKDSAEEVTQNDVTAAITRFNRGGSVNGVTVTQNDVTVMITLFERS
jgi:hypothetical protein